MSKDINVTDKYVCFWGSELSNFYPCNITYRGLYFKTSEQAFMWEKAMYFKDYAIAEQILDAETPYEAKKLGRKVKGFNDDDWASVRYDIMKTIVFKKFEQNTNLKKLLLNKDWKDKIFVEGSPFDKIWGVGISYDSPLIADENNWKGENLLGKVLCEVRKMLS